MAKKRYFVIVSHCLLNPSTRVHLLGRRYEIAQRTACFLLSKSISIIQLPCPEFTAMGYWRNPQGRQQYDNVFFRKHCRQALESYVDMICELKNNDNTPLCYIGIQASPNCCVYWGKHKKNRYKTESFMEEKNATVEDTTSDEKNTSDEGNKIEDENALEDETPITVYGVMTEVLDEMLKELDIDIPYLEAPVKENMQSEKALAFFQQLNDLL